MRRMPVLVVLTVFGVVAGLFVAPTSASSAGPVAAEHKVWVAAVDYMAYPRVDSDASVNAIVGSALDYWTRESRGIVTFKRASAAVTQVPGNPGMCSSFNNPSDAQQLTADAAAATGFPGGANNHLIVLVPASCSYGTDVGAASSATSIHEGGWAITRAGSRGVANVIGFLAANLGFGDTYVYGYRHTGYSDAYSMTSEPSLPVALGAPTSLGTAQRAMLGLLDSAPWQTIDGPTEVRMGQRGDDDFWDETVGLLVEYRGRTYGLDYRAGRGAERLSYYAMTGQFGSSGIRYPLGITMTLIDPATRETALIPSFYQVAGYYANPSSQKDSWIPRDGEPGLPISIGGTTVGGEYQLFTLRPAPGETMRIKYDLRRSPVLRIAGTPKIGSRMNGVLSDTVPGRTYTYRWTAGRSLVSSSAALSVPPSLGGQRLQLVVDVFEGNQREYRLQETVQVPRGRLASSTPRIFGKARVGARLKVAPGKWTNGARLRFRWYVAGKPQSGSSTKTFVVPRKAAGKTIRVKITGDLTGYVQATRTSRATAKVRR